jgi:hypothetical protein
MQRRWIPVAVLAASTLTLAPTGLAGAAGQPNQTTGQPNDSCQTTVANGGTEPGNASASPGSPFNEPNPATNNPGGTGGTAYTTGNGHSPQTNVAVSQYDVACANVTAHSH